MDTKRPVFRPQLPKRPTLIRTPRDPELFRGWGITL
jgi:hypothetical protein